jgi:hypothetical protein
MQETVSTTVTFAKPGPANTERTLALVKARAEALGIETILVATTRGETGLQATRMLAPRNVIAVTHSAGFREPFTKGYTPEIAQAIEAAGGTILTTTHAFGGIGRAVRKALNTYQVDEIIAYTLRTFGQGMKVAAEITLMASDAGLVPDAGPIIAVAGSGRGADTAAVILPTHTQTFFDLHFLEILCMPAPGHPAFGGAGD